MASQTCFSGPASGSSGSGSGGHGACAWPGLVIAGIASSGGRLRRAWLMLRVTELTGVGRSTEVGFRSVRFLNPSHQDKNILTFACVLCGSPVCSPPVVDPLWGPRDSPPSPLCVGLCVRPLCGSPMRVPSMWVPSVWVPCVGPLCTAGVGPSTRCVPCIYSRDASRSLTRTRSRLENNRLFTNNCWLAPPPTHQRHHHQRHKHTDTAHSGNSNHSNLTLLHY